MNYPHVLPSIETLLGRFHYFPETGELISKKTGKRAGHVRANGYLYVSMDGKTYGHHRLIYLLSTGEDPGQFFIDHINHNPSDNRPSNLRKATLQENTRNTKTARADSGSGIRGVSWHKNHKKWYANIRVNGKQKHLGSFDSKDEASIAAESARLKYFGEFCGGT